MESQYDSYPMFGKEFFCFSVAFWGDVYIRFAHFREISADLT